MKNKIVAALLALTMMAGCGAAAETGVTTTGGGETTTETKTETTEETTETSTTTFTSLTSKNVTEEAPSIEVNTEKGELTEKQIGALSASSFEIMNQVSKAEGKRSNILVSPTSMMMAFGMVENGARGETLSQIENTFGAVPVEQMNPFMYSLGDRFNSSEDVKWNVANSVWFKNDGLVEVVPDFASNVKNYYGADVWMAPFDETTAADINGWVNNETRGMIPEIINQIPDDARMYLINAMAFEGEWLVEYTDTEIFENEKFNNYDGSTSDVTMLFSTENEYFRIAGGTGFIRPYKGGEYSFVGILPEEGTSVEDYLAKLAEDGDKFAEKIRNPKYNEENVIVRIPEFSDDYDIEMSEIFKAMGMTDAFDEEKSDLTSMLNPLTEDEYRAWISRVLHKTHIEVDREGTRAAAVTAIEVTDNCMAIAPEEPVVITLDRPFVYGIVDNATGLPVFLGCVNQL